MTCVPRSQKKLITGLHLNDTSADGGAWGGVSSGVYTGRSSYPCLPALHEAVRWRPRLGKVDIRPFTHRLKYGQQRCSELCERVGKSPRVLLVRRPAYDATGLQPLESIGQYVCRDPVRGVEELPVSLLAGQHVPDNDQAPSVAHDIQCGGNGATGSMSVGDCARLLDLKLAIYLDC